MSAQLSIFASTEDSAVITISYACDFGMLPFQVTPEGDALEELHSFSGLGACNQDILYPRGAMRLVISRPRKPRKGFVNGKYVRYQISPMEQAHRRVSAGNNSER